MIKLADETLCTGCGACVNSCAHSAIRMSEDTEGFLMPIIDKEKCIDCGLCQKRCPQLNALQVDMKKQCVYAVINYEDRTVSSSGGAFSMFARYILSQGGIVYGAAFEPFPHLKHIGIEYIEDLDKLRGSKYVQSDVGESYKEAKSYLKKGRMVLFTGTPCQIAGLYTFLCGNRYENQLFTLDLVCHGVPNVKVFATYLQKLKKTLSTNLAEQSDVLDFRFRTLDSWDYRPAVKFSAKNSWVLLYQEKNAFMSSFFKGILFRKSCYSCSYANCERMGTFTIADFWGIGAGKQKFKKNVASGVSLVLDNYGKMTELLSEFGDKCYIEERTLEEARAKNDNLNFAFPRPDERNTAVDDMLDKSVTLMQYSEKYHLLDNFFKNLIKKTFKNIIYKFHLYNLYKSITYRLGKTS